MAAIFESPVSPLNQLYFSRVNGFYLQTNQKEMCDCQAITMLLYHYTLLVRAHIELSTFISDFMKALSVTG